MLGFPHTVIQSSQSLKLGSANVFTGEEISPEGFSSCPALHSVSGVEVEPALFPPPDVHLVLQGGASLWFPPVTESSRQLTCSRPFLTFIVDTARLSKDCVRPHSCLIIRRALVKEIFLKQENT